MVLKKKNQTKHNIFKISARLRGSTTNIIEEKFFS